MNAPHPTVVGAILAGGLSARMGQPKQSMVMPDGSTMMEHVAGALQAVCDRMVVVIAPGSLEDAGGHVTIGDLRPGYGPLGGIEALLASDVDEEAQYLICPCDVPLITPALLRMLLKPSKLPATVFQVEGREEFEPLPARISAAALPMVRSSLDQNQRAVWKLMEQLQPEIVAVSGDWAKQLQNVNTPEEWGELGLGNRG